MTPFDSILEHNDGHELVLVEFSRLWPEKCSEDYGILTSDYAPAIPLI